jgi:hypothetical protein
MWWVEAAVSVGRDEHGSSWNLLEYTRTATAPRLNASSVTDTLLSHGAAFPSLPHLLHAANVSIPIPFHDACSPRPSSSGAPAPCPRQGWRFPQVRAVATTPGSAPRTLTLPGLPPARAPRTEFVGMLRGARSPAGFGGRVPRRRRAGCSIQMCSGSGRKARQLVEERCVVAISRGHSAAGESA